VRIETEFWYACPIHAATLSKAPGVCPLDKRQKMPVVVTVHWVCNQSPDQKLMEPGQCADARLVGRSTKSARTAITTRATAASSIRPPTTGITSKAPIRTRGLFRVFCDDDFTQPNRPISLTPARLACM
jgi:hypothetical protein